MSPGAMKLANWCNDNIRQFVESADRTGSKGGMIQLALAGMLHKMAHDLTSAALTLGTSSDIEIAKNLPTIH